jgi:small subunit ribosomal protein S9
MADKTPPTYLYATGRRKTAVAQVRLYPKGTGKVTVNEKPADSQLTGFLAPLTLVGLADSIDVSAHTHGGGVMGQSEAIRHGIARALVVMDENFKTTLRKAGYLTRDPRAKERKKFGLKGARRAPQWSKR